MTHFWERLDLAHSIANWIYQRKFGGNIEGITDEDMRQIGAMVWWEYCTTEPTEDVSQASKQFVMTVIKCGILRELQHIHAIARWDGEHRGIVPKFVHLPAWKFSLMLSVSAEYEIDIIRRQLCDYILSRLPSISAEVLRLRYLKELPARECQKILGIDHEAVDSRVSYALLRLRRITLPVWTA